MNTPRRRFLLRTVSAAAIVASPHMMAEENRKPPPPAARPDGRPPEQSRPPRQDPELVFEFVRAGHTNLSRVQELVAQYPNLVRASWDWGGGDWETALGAASHVGNRPIAQFLLQRGARIDAFCAAMLGQTDTVLSLLRSTPSVATTKGPHDYTLLYHAAISGAVSIAAAIKPLLPADAGDYTQALAAAVRDGHLEMTRWLFGNGPVDANVRDALGKRPLAVAQEKGFRELADELRRHGART